MGAAGMDYVETNFSEAAIAKNLSNVLDRFVPR
jgi:hypothetical protein